MAVVALVLAAALAYASLTRGLPPLEQLTVLLNPQDGHSAPAHASLRPHRSASARARSPPRTLPVPTSTYVQFPQALVDATLALSRAGFLDLPRLHPKGWQDPQAHPTLAQRLVYDLVLWDQPASTPAQHP